MHRQTFGPVLAILLILPAARLRAEGGIQLPRLFDPPPPRAQVADAQIWDPYPMQGLANATDHDGRPRDFFYPPPEASRLRYGNPGTFPRPAPWVRSSAPADYPNLRKRWLRKRAESAAIEENFVPQEPIETPAPAAQRAARSAK
jgi:hypothetical protein